VRFPINSFYFLIAFLFNGHNLIHPVAQKKIWGYPHPIERTKLYDVPAIELEKSLIDKDPVAHIHILVLTDKAGINEFKLKLGFRELFQTTQQQDDSHRLP
jgi:hypothetical protein